MVTALLALGALAVLVFVAFRLVIQRADLPQLYRNLGVCGLLAIEQVSSKFSLLTQSHRRGFACTSVNGSGQKGFVLKARQCMFPP